jgi:hypothetical protein
MAEPGIKAEPISIAPSPPPQSSTTKPLLFIDDVIPLSKQLKSFGWQRCSHLNLLQQVEVKENAVKGKAPKVS